MGWSNMKGQKIEDDRFDSVLVYFEKTFYGKELEDNELVYHVRKRINGKIHWREVTAPKSTLHTKEGKEFYLDSLHKELQQIKKKINEQEGSS